jgi:prolyl oligopeptidase
MLLRSLPVAAALAAWAADAPPAPKTRVDNVKEIIHGVEIVDPYRWLEDQESPETRAWIDSQNAYARTILAGIPGREALKRRIAELLKVDSIDIPIERGGRYFFSKRRADQDLDIIYMRKGAKGNDEVLVDPHPLSAAYTISVRLIDVSKDGSRLAYSLRDGGADEVEIRLLDVETRKELPDRLPKARYWGVSIKPDRSGFYYTRFGQEGPRACFHAMGTDPSTDKLIFGDGLGRDKTLSTSLSYDGRYLLFLVSHGVGGDAKTEVYFQDLESGGPIVTVVNDIDAKFRPQIGGDRLFLRTDWKAPNWRVFSVDLRNPARGNWREVVPEGKAPIEYLTPAGGRLFVNYLDNVVSRVKVLEPDGRHVRDITFSALGTVTPAFGRWESDEAFYLFSSYHVPSTVYRYHISSGRQAEWERLKVPVDSGRFDLKQVWYSSKDGGRMPMFVLHRKELKLDGNRPALLTGYGGFSISETPSFDEKAVLWAEHGGVFAVANLRGGAEFGEEWHRAGMLAKKQNVFDDFIAAAEWLIANRYTSASRLAIEGTSNGGLLVGAALTQRPDLFRAVLCRYPLLDMIRYHKFLVARWWVPEYGSSENSDQFQYLYAYSPYHRVKPGTKYPAVLLVSGDADTRVAPLHARKMAALLQAANGSDLPVILKYEVKSGHIRAKPVAMLIDEKIGEWGFLLWQTGALEEQERKK